MFRIVDSRTTWQTVTVVEPTESGKPIKNKFELKLEMPGNMEDMQREFEELGVDEDVTVGEVNQRANEIVRSRVLDWTRDWRGVGDEAGNPVDFSRERLEAVMRDHFARKAIYAAFHKVMRVGDKEATVKN